MPARLPVTGPAELFVNSGDGTRFAFLGTDEGDPHIEIIPTLSPVYSDYGGAVPTDYLFEGEEAVVAMNLSRWDEAVYFGCAARANHRRGVAGTSPFGRIGALEVLGRNTFQSVVRFPYFRAAANAAAGVPSGYHFFACELFGPDDLRVGARLGRVQVIIRAMRVFIDSDGVPVSPGTVPAATIAATGAAGFALYTTTIPTGIFPPG